MRNKVAIRTIFKYLKTEKFIPYDVTFPYEDNGVVHFRIRSLPRWKFGMWLTYDNSVQYPKVAFFCQHEDFLDKFRPSRSFFTVHITAQQFADFITEHDTLFVSDIIMLLNHIKHNPIVAYVQNKNNWFPPTDSSVMYVVEPNNYLLEYIKGKTHCTRKKIKNLYEDIVPILTQKPKLMFLSRFDVVDHVEFKDLNDGCFTVSPRYILQIYFKKLYEVEELQEDAETAVLYKLFHKNLWMYKNIAIDCYRDWEGKRPYTYTLYANKK